MVGVVGRETGFEGEGASEGDPGVSLALSRALEGLIPLTGVAKKILKELVRRREGERGQGGSS